MDYYDEFKVLRQYRKVADELIAHSLPEELAACARLLALNVAHYQAKYGTLPLQEFLALFTSDTRSEEQIKLMSDGMQMLVGILGFVRSEDDRRRFH